MSLPPAQPAYILRGHAAQIHSTTFIRANSRLVTGDADGWVVLWDTATKRPVVVWQAHQGAILGISTWGQNALITHGKDDKLVAWKLTEEDESDMSIVLPVDDRTSHRKQPWVMHILHVNTLNFCAFASCKSQGKLECLDSTELVRTDEAEELLIAVPNTISSETVDIFHLPSERRIHTVSGDKTVKTGMVMSVAIFYKGKDLIVIAGFESGHAAIFQLADSQGWHIIYMSQPHSQPILSLAVAADQFSFITSSADAIIAKHPIPFLSEAEFVLNSANPSSNVGASAPFKSGISLLSQSLAAVGQQNKTRPLMELETKPLKTVQTKHSGQQGLRIRSDGKIFATAGWDSRVRVYSVQSLKELAVLKWHKEGCYAVAFADVVITDGRNMGSAPGINPSGSNSLQANNSPTSKILTVKEKRDFRATTTHWLAAGSKDGKVSLWDIY